MPLLAPFGRSTQQTARQFSLMIVVLQLSMGEAQADPPTQSWKPNITARPRRIDGSLPIPTPKPIVMDESWLVAERFGVTPASADEPARSPVVPPEEPPQSPPGFPDKPPEAGPNSLPVFPNGPHLGGLNQPPGMSPPFPGSSPYLGNSPMSETATTDLEYPLGEFFNIRAFEQIGKTLKVATNRDEIILVLGASRTDGALSNPSDSIRVVGQKLGLVELTLIGERGVKRHRVRITPSVAQIEALIARQFPQSNVEVTAAGDNALVLDGTVESPGDVEGILQLIQNFVGPRGKVVNGIKVSGVMQVQLEVVIARVDRAELRRLGLNFEYAGTGGYAGSTIGNIGGVTPIASSVANNAATAGGNAFQSIGGAATSVVTPASTVFLGITDNLQQFMAQIEALQQQGVAKVLAKPILTTLNGRPAEFLVGGEQPYPYQTNSLSSPSVEFKKFGTRLNFVPIILSPDKIRLDLVPEHSSVNFTQSLVVGGYQIPQFITQRIHTTVEMESGQTLVLGGLLQTESDAQVQKVPFLGDLPLVGAAFRRISHQEREIELIIVVTPRLVHPLSETDCPLPLPGDESRRPTDKELYWHGLPEAPLESPEAGEHASHLMQYEAAGTSSRRTSVSGKAVVQQVAEKKTERTSKSWMRLPSLNRKQQQPGKMGQ